MMRQKYGAVCLWLGILMGPVAADEMPPANEPQAKVLPLLGMISSSLLSALGNQASSQMGVLYKRLTGAQASAVAEKPAELFPAVTYAIDRLDPVSFAVVAEVDTRQPVLQTGDVFAIRYATNLPGQVRLENIDPNGVKSDLGTYSVLIGQDNRIPRTRGIRLDGKPGSEVVLLHFYPCLPQEARGAAWASQFRNRLPVCGAGRSEALQLAASGQLHAKILVNLEQPDPGLSVAASTDFVANEVLSLSMTIKHAAPTSKKSESEQDQSQ